MANAPVDIYNLALSGIGTRDSVGAVDEASREAEMCTLWYSTVVDAVFRAAPWSCATAYQRLAVLAERDFNVDWVAGDPPPEWGWEYAAPADMIRPRYLTSFNRFDLGIRNTTHIILSSEEEAILCYTMRQENVVLWDADLTMAISAGLGARIAMGLTGKIGRARDALTIANNLIEQARQHSANEREVTYDSVPSWLAVRGSPAGLSLTSYVFPNGPILSLPNVG